MFAVKVCRGDLIAFCQMESLKVRGMLIFFFLICQDDYVLSLCSSTICLSLNLYFAFRGVELSLRPRERWIVYVLLVVKNNYFRDRSEV